MPDRLFPHHLDRVIARMHHTQRFEVVHPALGPWTKGDIIERHVDLVGAFLPRLLECRAIVPTHKPAFKHAQTIANLKSRGLLTPIVAEALQSQGLILPAQAIAPIPGIPSTSTISIPAK